MAELICKTRGNSSAQGKPRVYFCAHPKDFACMSALCADVLDKQNCVIWYKENADAVLDQAVMDVDLGRMQLFLLPITENFLLDDSAAKDELAFALENHIPVLPLLQKSGLDKLFNEKYGGLQFLEKEQKDSTAISYEEKLEKFLASVLIGDETAERIRSAFDAYIFLSYRKKDRAHAQALMRAIHQNDFCRDIAIWYDEFLTPGEYFDNAIELALKKSALFTMVVTPNLLEPENYVMEKEYPMAHDAEKKILPVEMLPTDRYALNAFFEGIPQPIDGQDEGALCAALQETVQVSFAEKKKDALHVYLVGLAYLSGVDVEVDKERGVRLIVESAEAGCLEAIGKLAEMYRAGEGVERDLRAAIEYQNALVSALEQRYTAAKSDEEKRKLAGEFAMAAESLGEYYYDMGNTAASKNAYYKVRQVEEYLEGDAISPARLSLLYQRLADVFTVEGKASKALNYYLKSVSLEEELLKKQKKKEAGARLLSGYLKTAATCRDMGLFEDARKRYAHLLTATKDMEALALAEFGLGETELEEERTELAEKHFLQASETLKKLLKERDYFKAKLYASYTYARLCGLSLALGKAEKAKKYVRLAIESAEYLVIEYGGAETERALAFAYAANGEWLQSRGDEEGAKSAATESFLLLLKLASDTESAQAQADLAFSYEALAQVSSAYERRGLLENALVIWERLATECPRVARHRRQRDKIRALLKGDK